MISLVRQRGQSGLTLVGANKVNEIIAAINAVMTKFTVRPDGTGSMVVGKGEAAGLILDLSPLVGQIEQLRDLLTQDGCDCPAILDRLGQIEDTVQALKTLTNSPTIITLASCDGTGFEHPFGGV